MSKFNINEEWKEYCRKVGIPYERTDDPIIIKAKRAFYAGFAQMIVVLGKMSGEEKDYKHPDVKEIGDLQLQIIIFFSEELNIIPRN